MIQLSEENLEIQKTLIDLHAKKQLRGAFKDIPNEVYHHPKTPGISSTGIKRIAESSIAHWLDEVARGPALEFGAAMHVFMNEPHQFQKYYSVCPDDRRTAIRTPEGKIILRQRDFQMISVMSKKLFKHPTARQLLVGAQTEVTYFAYDQETGVLKKARVDAIKGKAISDLKSCESAAPDDFAADCRRYNYKTSAAFYLEVVSEATGEPHEHFFLVACEKQNPHEIATYRVDESSLVNGGEIVRKVLRKLKAAQDAGPDAWLGYELGTPNIII